MKHLTLPRLLFLLAAAPFALATSSAVSATTTHTPACTATASAGIGGFFDLRPDIAIAAEDGKTKRGARATDYEARGYDYKSNFTLNICASVLKPVEEVVGLKRSEWKNVSAYYVHGGDVFSIGQESMQLQSRGRKLVLQYKGGSPCADKKARDKRSSVHDGAAFKFSDYSDEDEDAAAFFRDDDDQKHPSKDDDKDTSRRKSTTISFLCDRDPTSSSAGVSFVGTDPDECAYFFEVRSQHACASAEPHQPGSVGPGGVFALIFAIALLVYIFGGIFYNRTVAHARGWRQLPNYSLWAGIWGFITDILVIATSSCARFLPSRRGYRHLSLSPNGRNRNRDDENRLIDQLDEEWDD